ncbi:IPTL-CTERM sorting domain-containing protein [Acidovorax sp. MR-S7]|uniref:IPTL-CTERM sorting domain-containing protein n=1 Tax=Acidovorax sp. MR-S7 TaxID=1268622 RepID=UPI00039B30AD|nr:IPTL-CTERM sorting domain-containing protein [Acidovorax sp. MR-S7]
MKHTDTFRAALLACALAPWAQAGTIATVAGTGMEGAGTDGPATASALGYITRLAADEQGRVYIADSTNGRVRRLDADGSITTVVSGLNLVEGLAVGGDKVYVATGYERRVLRFNLSDPAAPVYLLAATSRDASGLALSPGNTHLYSVSGGRMGIINLTNETRPEYLNMDELSGISFMAGLPDYLYIAERGGHKAWKSQIPGPGGLTSPSLIAGDGTQGFGGDGGPAAEAQLNEPADVVADSVGNLYIADLGNHRVRRIDGLGLIETIAGTGDALSTPGTPVGDGGPATAAIVSDPNGLLAVGDHTLYVAENTGHRVRRITFDPPAAPTQVQATILNDRAIVAWEHDGDKATGFTAAAYTGGSTPGLLCHAPAGERHCTIDGLAGGSHYGFRVLARNGADVSPAAWSAGYPTPTPLTEADVDLDGTGAAQARVSIGKSPASTCSTVRGLEFTATPPGAPASAPLGVLRFKAEDCNAGSHITVRIDYPPGSLAGLYPWKYGPRMAGGQPEWFRWGTVHGDTVYYTVSNDGIGDSAPNDASTIEDPHAMLPLAALPPAPGPGGAVQAVPALSAWGVALLSALAALLGLRRRG